MVILTQAHWGICEKINYCHLNLKWEYMIYDVLEYCFTYVSVTGCVNSATLCALVSLQLNFILLRFQDFL